MATVITWPACRAQIKTIAAAALANYRSKVIGRELLGMSQEVPDLSVFRPISDGNRVNSLMFWRSAAQQPTQGDAKTGPRPVASLSRQTAQGRYLAQEWPIQFRLYLGYASGSDASNSQDEFDAMIDALTLAFAAKPTLGLQSEFFQSTSPLIWSATRLQQFGDLSAHCGIGTLIINVGFPVTVNP